MKNKSVNSWYFAFIFSGSKWMLAFKNWFHDIVRLPLSFTCICGSIISTWFSCDVLFSCCCFWFLYSWAWACKLAADNGGTPLHFKHLITLFTFWYAMFIQTYVHIIMDNEGHLLFGKPRFEWVMPVWSTQPFHLLRLLNWVYLYNWYSGINSLHWTGKYLSLPPARLKYTFFSFQPCLTYFTLCQQNF